MWRRRQRRITRTLIAIGTFRSPPARRSKKGYLDTSTFGFSDELKALSEASGIPADTTTGEVLGGFAAIPGAASLGYEKFTGHAIGRSDRAQPMSRALAAARAQQKAAEEQHPTAYTLGQIGGGVADAGHSAPPRARPWALAC